MKTLNYIPLPFIGESPSSIIRRLAVMNGYSSISLLTSSFCGHGYTAHGSSLIQGNRYESMMLAQVGSTLHMRIHNGFYPLADPDKPDGSFLVGELKLRRSLLRARSYPRCSECHKADHFHFINDLCLCSYCPIHQLKLLDDCPRCKRRLRLRHLGHQSCSCGAAWESSACSEDDCLPEKRLLAIVDQQDQTKLDALLSAFHMFGISRNKVNRASHLIFDAATSVVFGDCERLQKLLPRVWDSIDSTQAGVLSLKFKKNYPKLGHLLDELPEKSLMVSETCPARPISGNALRILLGLGTPLWTQFQKSHPEYDKQSYDGEDIAQISLAVDEFRMSTKGQQTQFERETLAACYSLADVTKILGLSPSQCKILLRKEILVPTTAIRTTPYYRKEDVKTFQDKYMSTYALASLFKKTSFEIIAAINRCKSVEPIFDRRGNPFLIHLKDLNTVSLSIGTIPKKNNSLRGKKNLRRCFMGGLRTYSLDQAAAVLKTHRNTVIYYRDIGLIQCSNHDTRTFLSDDVEKFYERFTTPRILSKELNVSINKLHCILEAHNVHAISGNLINGHSITVYDRSQLPENLKTLLNPMNDSFGKCLSENRVVSLREAAETLNIKRGDLIRIALEQIRPNRPPMHRSNLKISEDEIALLKTKLTTLTPLTKTLETYALTRRAFARRFISKNFVHPIKLNDQEFLTPSDTMKIKSFMSEYCTILEASKLLGFSAPYAKLVLKKNNVNFYWVSNYGFRHQLLKRNEIQAMLDSIKCNPLSTTKSNTQLDH